ncbi:MAG: DMT family transporter [Eubacteriales bacterium]|nr:DMT family transporter [bacterium]MDY2791818.1 DMT family transporter [Eubacteriales bacterium]
MWFWLAIAAMLCWSGSDLFSKIGSRPDDKYSHWKMVMAVGLVMGVHAIVTMLGGVKVTLQDIVHYLPASSMYILSMVLGYVGLRYIELSISSPICNSSGAVASLLCFIFLGQKLSGLQTVAVIMVCVGVVLMGFVEANEDQQLKLERQKRENISYTRSALALILPIAYCLIDGLGTFADTVILEHMDEEVANTAYELTFLLMGLISFVYVVLIKKQPLTVRREGPKLLGAVCETAGQFAYVFAIAANAIAAAPIISSYCLASVLWSRIFLKEKLSWKHYACILLAAAGIIILGVLDEIA